MEHALESPQKSIIQPDVENSNVVTQKENPCFLCPEFGYLKKTDPDIFL